MKLLYYVSNILYSYPFMFILLLIAVIFNSPRMHQIEQEKKIEIEQKLPDVSNCTMLREGMVGGEYVVKCK